MFEFIWQSMLECCHYDLHSFRIVAAITVNGPPTNNYCAGYGYILQALPKPSINNRPYLDPKAEG